MPDFHAGTEGDSQDLLSFHTLVNMTKALHQISQEGHTVDLEALATFSPYRTGQINRFGDYAINRNRTPEPLEHHLAMFPANE